jgi:hypothetical protein
MIDLDRIPDIEDLAPEQERWVEYERRKRAWLEANPGAWPLEVRDACARIAEELGL